MPPSTTSLYASPHLPGCHPLSSQVYIRPPTETPQAGEPHPLTILLLFWMEASPRHMTKYITQHALLSPKSRIVVVLTTSGDLFLRNSEAAQRGRLGVVIKALGLEPQIEKGFENAAADVEHATNASERKTDEEKDLQEGGLFIHVFSNGGTFTLSYLAQAYKALRPPNSQSTLPVKSMILDSCPGKKSALSTSAKALSFALLPPHPSTPLIQPLVKAAIYLTVIIINIYVSIIARQSKSHNYTFPVERGRAAVIDVDNSLLGEDVSRCFIYSDGDEVVLARDVEEAAADVARKEKDRVGGRGGMVRMEKFEGSRHVEHMRADEERYWRVVREQLWRARRVE